MKKSDEELHHDPSYRAISGTTSEGWEIHTSQFGSICRQNWIGSPLIWIQNLWLKSPLDRSKRLWISTHVSASIMSLPPAEASFSESLIRIGLKPGSTFSGSFARHSLFYDGASILLISIEYALISLGFSPMSHRSIISRAIRSRLGTHLQTHSDSSETTFQVCFYLGLINRIELV